MSVQLTQPVSSPPVVIDVPPPAPPLIGNFVSEALIPSTESSPSAASLSSSRIIEVLEFHGTLNIRSVEQLAQAHRYVQHKRSDFFKRNQVFFRAVMVGAVFMFVFPTLWAATHNNAFVYAEAGYFGLLQGNCKKIFEDF